MCGITGFFNQKNCERKVRNVIKELNRGNDGYNVLKTKNGFLGHQLHSIVGNKVNQPFEDENSFFLSNCEIYNWKKLNKKYGFKTLNDARTLHKMLDLKGLDALNELDGVHAFCYIKENKLFLSRDVLGINPLWYSLNDGFSFSSSKKTLNCSQVFELNPRQVLVYDLITSEIVFKNKDFFKIPSKKTNPYNDLFKIFEDSVMKRVPKNQKLGVLLSGGVDSVSICHTLLKNKIKFIAYHAVLSERENFSEDLKKSKIFCEKYGISLKIIKPKLVEVKKVIKKIIQEISSPDPIKIGVGLVTYYATLNARTDGVKVVMSGSGSEEIFHSYKRHEQSKNLDEDSINELLSFYEKNSYRDNVLSFLNGVELRLPFLDLKLIETALKFESRKRMNKDCFREVLKKTGLSDEFRLRTKKSAQYPSGFDWCLKKLSKINGFKSKGQYLQSLTPVKDCEILGLISGGKDSMLSVQIMKNKGYDVTYLGVIHSKNKDSYMYHTPNTHLVKKISMSLKIPLLEETTDGVKEKELTSLKKLLKNAKSLGVKGVVNGAIYSNYQKKRIVNICESLGLKFFTPLWNTNEVEIIKTVSKKPWNVIFTKIASDGFDQSWLGKKIDETIIKKLISLEKTHGIHPAGEGGEYETLVINAPMYVKPISYEVKEKIMEKNNIGELVLK